MTSGHGVESLFIEIMNLWARLRRQGKLSPLNLILLNIKQIYFFRYGFAANKLICLGFIRKAAEVENKIVTRDYILAKDAVYEVDVAGHRFSATPYLHAPTVPYYEKKEYRPTAIKYQSDISD